MSYTRRRVLGSLAAGTSGAVAGCLSGSSDPPEDGSTATGTPEPTPEPQTSDGPLVDLGVPCTGTEGAVDLSGGRPATEFERAAATPAVEYADGEIPLREAALHLGHERTKLADRDMSGGVGHDGIPSVDEPRFARGDEIDLPGCARVFGVDLDGDVRAYPQRILVRHEIVNDVIGGEPVAVTYCPLTGTAQGFYRGGVEFGVSGRLVNSNLVMWDRHRDVRWSQVAATAFEVGDQRGGDDGGLLGRSLREFRLFWTTWNRWRSRHPDTLVMTEETGLARNYNRDPYGSYGPPVSGHYALGEPRQPNFPLLTYDEADEKRVVVGSRTSNGAIAFDKRALMESSVMTGSVGETPVVAVADRELAVGYVYANPDRAEVEPDGDEYAVDGRTAPPDELPLDRLGAFDAMWFAWYGFYPDTERVGI
jgi:hypothetical protein